MAAILARTPPAAVVCVTGSGGPFLGWLTSTPGISALLLEGIVAHSRNSSTNFLEANGQALPQKGGFCSPSAAVALATASLNRALFLTEEDSRVGLACTGTLASVRPHHGDHRVHVATATPTGIHCYSHKFVKGELDRAGEDRVCSLICVAALADVAFGRTGCGEVRIPCVAEKKEEEGETWITVPRTQITDGTDIT